jgi:hypothetical protein
MAVLLWRQGHLENRKLRALYAAFVTSRPADVFALPTVPVEYEYPLHRLNMTQAGTPVAPPI